MMAGFLPPVVVAGAALMFGMRLRSRDDTATSRRILKRALLIIAWVLVGQCLLDRH